MPLDRNLTSQQPLGPDELALMKRAFDEVWTAYASRIISGHQDARDVLAMAITQEAMKGERNLSALVEVGKKVIAKT